MTAPVTGARGETAQARDEPGPERQQGERFVDEYFLILTVIDVVVLLFMCMMIHASENLSDRQKRGFLKTYLLIAVISILEVITVIVNETPVQYRWINLLANYLGFALTPAVPLCLVHILDKQGRRQKIRRGAAVLWLVYIIFLAVSLPSGAVFGVEADNRYFRGEFFHIYVAMYFMSIVYLAVATSASAIVYQNKSKILIFPLMGFLLLGTIVQLAFPDIHTTWLCVTLISVLYYIYCNEMWNQLDGLTGLLNQASYLNRTSSARSGDKVLIVFDVDRFKQINDTYGHLYGDRCLREIADCMKAAYARYGGCYRMGGDEFCVILRDEDKEDACAGNFLRLLEERRRENPHLPTVSYGSAVMESGENILTTKERADQNMYQFKKARREKTFLRV